MLHALEHAVKDTLLLCPWLVLIYVVIELLENKTDLSSSNRLGGKLGPLIGAATGLIPQCGFSVFAAKLFEKRYITLGTLFAIFFSTSDEAFIVLLTGGEGAVWLLPLIAVKVLVGVGVGYAADGVMKVLNRSTELKRQPEKIGEPKTVKEMFLKNVAEEETQSSCTSCGRPHDGASPLKIYLISPLLHAAQVAVFIFLVNFVLGWIIEEVGEGAFVAFMQKNVFLQPLLTAAIGLIPNCASSVVITQTFLMGGISFGSLACGLCANAGLGFVVLAKNVKKWKRNIALLGVSFVVSVVLGLLLNLFPLYV
ncbi:MAG: arsenic efflux protein [Clostridia bacterium]|nr:arsenic efflux protein [Clostridia bacterium]